MKKTQHKKRKEQHQTLAEAVQLTRSVLVRTWPYIYMHDFRVGRVFGLEVWFGRCGVDRGKLGLHERLFTAAQLL